MQVNEVVELVKYWFSKSILSTHIIPFEDVEAYETALAIFRYDYEVYPNAGKWGEGKELMILEEFPSLQAILLYRLARYYFLQQRNDIAMKYSLLGRFLSGMEIFFSADIGKGFKVYHGLGTVIGARTKIGEYCLFHQNITTGDKEGKRPIIGDFVKVYAGAKILGDCQIGNYATIGANAVVFQDVPENMIAVGVPARIIRPKN